MNPTEIDLPGPRRRRWRRLALWAALVGLLVVAQSLLVALTINYESNRAQEQVDAAASAAAAQLKQQLARDQQRLQALMWNDPPAAQWRADAVDLLRARPSMVRIERREPGRRVTDAVDSPFQTPLFTQMPRAEMELETGLACDMARRQAEPVYSRSYFVPWSAGLGLEVMDLCVPLLRAGQPDGYLTVTFALARLLDDLAAAEPAHEHELSFVEGDGTRLARAGLRRGGGVFVAERPVDLPGQTLQLRLDSRAGSPQLIPNLAVALVLGLSLALAVVVILLARDVRRRAGAEAALAEALAFRKAMEDSLITGLRARDTQGRITYVNPAFCEMVGFASAELIGRTVPPYWPPELADEYTRRQPLRLSAGTSATPSREGFETTFMRRSGERFPVLIFEAPLVNSVGRHTGWMSAVLDVSAQKRIEDLSRQQQERLQATARLATVGEMASLLSHELNQPLAAIASYAAGSLNLLDGSVDAESAGLLKQAAQRIAEQAERAGRVIKSVHDFVRRREQAREAVRADVLVDAVLPLVRLQARKSGTRVVVDLPEPPSRVLCDRTMLEQVLLNLTRNGIQAMEQHTEPARRELCIRVRQADARRVAFHVIDRGPGITADVAQRLFTPFFTTRSEGMGLGLSLCRTVVEQHGGVLEFENLAGEDPNGAMNPNDSNGANSANSARCAGTEFRFTLPAPERDGTPPAESPEARSAPFETVR